MREELQPRQAALLLAADDARACVPPRGVDKGPLTTREYREALNALRVLDQASTKMAGVIPTERLRESLSYVRGTIEEYG